nr:transposase [Streptomyces sp. NBC_01497]
MFALQPRKRLAKNTVLIVDGTPVPTRDHSLAEQSKSYRYSTNHQVVIDADTRLVVVVACPATATTARRGRNPAPRPPSVRP